MDKNRIWIIGSVLVMIVVLVLGWVVGVQPQLTAIALANDQRATVAETNAQQEAALAKLKEDFKSIDKLNAELVSLSESVPTGTEAPAFVSQLDALAIAQGVTLKGITMADPEAYAPVVPPAAATAATDDATDASGAEGSATPTPAPADTAGIPPVTSPLITPANLATLAVTVNVSGSYANVLNFVNGLQTAGRLVLVTGLTTTASTDAPDQVEATVSGLIYSLFVTDAPTEVGAG